MHFSSVDLYSPLGATFRMVSYELLQEVSCEHFVAELVVGGRGFEPLTSCVRD